MTDDYCFESGRFYHVLLLLLLIIITIIIAMFLYVKKRE
jgi:hypothetical protein